MHLCVYIHKHICMLQNLMEKKRPCIWKIARRGIWKGLDGRKLRGKWCNYNFKNKKVFVSWMRRKIENQDEGKSMKSLRGPSGDKGECPPIIILETNYSIEIGVPIAFWSTLHELPGFHSLPAERPLPWISVVSPSHLSIARRTGRYSSRGLDRLILALVVCMWGAQLIKTRHHCGVPSAVFPQRQTLYQVCIFLPSGSHVGDFSPRAWVNKDQASARAFIFPLA